MEKLKQWEIKANSIIASLCTESYNHMNPSRGIKHHRYSVPVIAQELVDILGMKDRKEAEKKAKKIFLDYNYLKQI